MPTYKYDIINNLILSGIKTYSFEQGKKKKINALNKAKPAAYNLKGTDYFIICHHVL